MAPLHTTGRSNRRTATAAALGLTATLLMSGCGSSNHPADKPSSSPVASVSTDPNAAAKAQLLAAYQNMWAAENKLFATGSYQGVDLESYTHDKALANIKDTAFYLQQHGMVYQGDPKLSTKVTNLNTSAQPNTATITDCIDSSHYVAIYKATGKPVDTQDTNRHHLETFTARTVNGQWMITDSSIDRSRTC